jgi:hypothetical protein
MSLPTDDSSTGRANRRLIAASRADQLVQRAISSPPLAIRLTCSQPTCERLLKESFTALKSAGESDVPSSLRQYLLGEGQEVRARRAKDPFADFSVSPLGELGYALETQVRAIRHGNWLHAEVDFGRSALCASTGVMEQGLAQFSIRRKDEQCGRVPPLASMRWGLKADRADPVADSVPFRHRGPYRVRKLRMHDGIDSFRGIAHAIGLNTTATRYVPLALRVCGEDPESNRRDLAHILEQLALESNAPMMLTKLGLADAVIVLDRSYPPNEEMTLPVSFAYRLRGMPGLSHGGVSAFPLAEWLTWDDPVDVSICSPRPYSVLGALRPSSSDDTWCQAGTLWECRGTPCWPVTMTAPIELGESLTRSRVGLTKPTELRFVELSSGQTSLYSVREQRQMLQLAARALTFGEMLFSEPYPFEYYSLVSNAMTAVGANGERCPGHPTLGVVDLFAHKAAGGLDIESASIADEVTRQWWGAIGWVRDRQAAWLNDAVPRYVAELFVEKEHGTEVAQARIDELHSRLRGFPSASSVAGDGPSPPRADGAKGVLFLHMLRVRAGMERFTDLLRALLRQARDRSLTLDRFSSIASDTLGFDVEPLVEDWIRSPGEPAIEIVARVRSTEDGGFLVRGTVSQSIVVAGKKVIDPNDYFRFRTELKILTVNGTAVTEQLDVAAREVEFTLKLKERPTKLLFAPANEIPTWRVRTHLEFEKADRR